MHRKGLNPSFPILMLELSGSREYRQSLDAGKIKQMCSSVSRGTAALPKLITACETHSGPLTLRTVY